MATFDPAVFAQQLKALEEAGAPIEQLTTLLRSLNAEQAEQVKSTTIATDKIKALADGRKAEIEMAVRSAEAQKELADARAADAAASKDKLKSIRAENAAIESQIELLKAQVEAAQDEATRANLRQQILDLEKYKEGLEDTKKEVDEFRNTIRAMAKDLSKAGEAMFAGEDAGKQFMSAIGGI